jgi:hypothetical protein
MLPKTEESNGIIQTESLTPASAGETVASPAEGSGELQDATVAAELDPPAPIKRGPGRPKGKKSSKTTAKPKATAAVISSSRAVRVPEAPPEPEAAPDPVPAVAIPEMPQVAAASMEFPPAPPVRMAPDTSIAQQISEHPLAQIGIALARQHKMWVVSASLVIAATATGGFLYSNRHATHAATTTPAAVVQTAAHRQTLALTAERRGADLVVSWNRDAAPISHAAFGVLVIRGNNSTRNIALSSEQLRAGSIVFTPASEQVDIELNVVAGEQVTKDNVIVLLPEKNDSHSTASNTHPADQHSASVIRTASRSRRSHSGSSDGGPQLQAELQ